MNPFAKLREHKSRRLPNYPLRLQPSLMEEARKVAKSERISLNQLINVCVAEKLSALRTESYFQEGIRRTERAIALRILDRVGENIPPSKVGGDTSPHRQVPEETKKTPGPAAPIPATRNASTTRQATPEL